jgi:hypothetical protein
MSWLPAESLSQRKQLVLELALRFYGQAARDHNDRRAGLDQGGGVGPLSLEL